MRRHPDAVVAHTHTALTRKYARLIPSYTGALILRSLRLLRIISFLRLERSYKALKNLRVVFGRKREELLVVSYLTMVVVLTSSTMIFFLENNAQPDVFSSIGVCAWWSVETITSLGYGDIVPRTSAGRIFGSALAIWGIVLFTIPGAVLGSGFIEVMLDKQQSAEEDEYDRALHEPTSRVGAAAETAATGSNTSDRSALQIDPPPATPLSAGTDAVRHLSPRVATALALHQLALKLDAMAATQVRLLCIMHVCAPVVGAHVCARRRSASRSSCARSRRSSRASRRCCCSSRRRRALRQRMRAECMSSLQLPFKFWILLLYQYEHFSERFRISHLVLRSAGLRRICGAPFAPFLCVAKKLPKQPPPPHMLLARLSPAARPLTVRPLLFARPLSSSMASPSQDAEPHDLVLGASMRRVLFICMGTDARVAAHRPLLPAPVR